MDETTEKETFGMKMKKFMIRNRKKFIVGGTIIGGTLLGGGILKRHMSGDDYVIDTVEEDYESVEYTGSSDDSTEESSEE